MTDLDLADQIISLLKDRVPTEKEFDTVLPFIAKFRRALNQGTEEKVREARKAGEKFAAHICLQVVVASGAVPIENRRSETLTAIWKYISDIETELRAVPVAPEADSQGKVDLQQRLAGRPRKPSREIFEDFGVPTCPSDYEDVPPSTPEAVCPRCGSNQPMIRGFMFGTDYPTDRCPDLFHPANREVKCGTCNGEGRTIQRLPMSGDYVETCPACHGTGKRGAQ